MQIKIPNDKEEIIYEMALKEFATNGYEKGSTNIIVKNAGISKGALFKYFGNKLNLYIYVVERAMKVLEDAMFGELTDLSSDMFERIAQSLSIKMVTSIKNRMESLIIVDCFGNQDEQIKAFVKEKSQYYYKMLGELYSKGIDYSKFKEGVDVTKVYEMLTYISEGLQNKYMVKYKGDLDKMIEDKDSMVEEVLSYTKMLRDSVYK